MWGSATFAIVVSMPCNTQAVMTVAVIMRRLSGGEAPVAGEPSPLIARP
jgi:hypothetical protein